MAIRPAPERVHPKLGREERGSRRDVRIILGAEARVILEHQSPGSVRAKARVAQYRPLAPLDVHLHEVGVGQARQNILDPDFTARRVDRMIAARIDQM